MNRAVMGLLLLGLVSPCFGAEPASFRFAKAIERDSTTGQCILAIPLDAGVYAATRDGLPDVRIFDAERRETPFAIEKAAEARTHTVREACPSRVESLHEREDGLELVVRLDKDAPAAGGLTIVTPLRNFERRVRVSGSRDGTAWTPIVSNGLVFDYARYLDIANGEVRLPANDFRQFQIVIEGVADDAKSPFTELTRKRQGGKETEQVERIVLERRPFRMDRIELWREIHPTLSETDRKADYAPAKWSVAEDAENKTSVVTVETRREPLTEFTLGTTSSNFNRAVVVQVPVARGVREEWIDVAHGRVSLVDFGGFHREELTLSFAERREPKYRIVIRNEDSPPIKITDVQARGNVYRAIYLADAGVDYRLCFGSDDMEVPVYDAATVLATLRGTKQPVEGRLGPQVAVGGGQPPAFNIRAILNNPLVLGAVVVVLVTLLGWALVRATQRINEIPKE